MNIQDHFSESLETVLRLKILKFFDADPDPGSGNFLTRESGMEKFGSRINIHSRIRNTVANSSDLLRSCNTVLKMNVFLTVHPKSGAEYIFAGVWFITRIVSNAGPD
jgi:hypothetical protein